jgi:hypothetical protein
MGAAEDDGADEYDGFEECVPLESVAVGAAELEWGH